MGFFLKHSVGLHADEWSSLSPDICGDVEEVARKEDKVDSNAVSIFEVILVELTNITNITTNIETVVLSRTRRRRSSKTDLRNCELSVG